jgi:hypothetical protein
MNKKIINNKVIEEKLNKQLNKGIENLKQIKMTALEKDKLLKNIIHPTRENTESIESTYFSWSSMQRFYNNRLVYLMIFVCLVIAMGNGVVLASNNSVPGDLLYPIKVKIVEPVHSALIISPSAKAEYESSLARKRLVEAEKLVETNKLSEEKEQELNLLLENHTLVFNKSIAQYRKKPNSEEEDGNGIVTDFQATMNAHAKVLEIMKSNDHGNKSENTKKNTSISQIARESAKKTGYLFKDTDKDIIANKYKKKKDNVKSWVEKTSIGLNKINNEDKNNFEKKEFVDSAQKTIDLTKQLIEESEKINEEGDSKNAYEKIYDSESSAKEVDIFLEAGLRINIKNIDH